MFDIEKLIEDYTPEPGPFPVVLPKGEVLTFRPFGDYGEFEALKKRAVSWYRSIADDPAHPYAELLPATPEGAVAAFVIAELSAEPRISQRDALRLLKAGPLVDHIVNTIEERSRTVSAIALKAAIDRELGNFDAPSHTESN